MRNDRPLFRGRKHSRALVPSAGTSSFTNNSSIDPFPSMAVGVGAAVTREDNQSNVYSSRSVTQQSMNPPFDSSTSVTQYALERRDTETKLNTASSSALATSEAPASLASEHSESNVSKLSSANDLRASTNSAENSLDPLAVAKEDNGTMDSPSPAPITPSSSSISSFDVLTEPNGGSTSSTSLETASASDLTSDQPPETPQSTSGASNTASEPSDSSTVDSPTQDSTTQDIPLTSTEQASPWSEPATTTPPPSWTPSAQQYAASQQATPATSVSWAEHSTYQESQPTQSYQQSSESYYFVAAVYAESSTSTETVWETSTVPLSTSQVIVNGQGHTSWVQSTSYSTVKRPITTIIASGKATTTGAANVAGASTATVATKTDAKEPGNPGSDSALSSSGGSMSKGDIAGIAIGCLTAVAGIILLLFFFCKRRRQRSGAVKLHDEYHPEMSSRSTLKRNGTQHSAMDFSDGPLYASRQPTLLDPVPELPESQRISKDGMWEYASDDGQRSPVRSAEARFTHFDDWLAYEYANSPFSEKHALPESTNRARASVDGDSITTTIRSPSNATNSIYGLPFDAHGGSSRFTPKLQTGPSIQSLHSVSTVEERHFGFSAEIGSIDEVSSVGHGSTSHATSVSYGSARGLIHHHHHVQSTSGTYGVAR